MPDYVPGPDDQFNRFQQIFVDFIVARGAALGFAGADITPLTAGRTAWNADYAEHLNKQADARAATEGKDSNRAGYEPLLRAAAQRAQTAPAMTDEWRVEAGLTVRETSRTRAGAPTSRPVGVVDTRQRRQHTITWTDEATPHTRAKPAGVRGCEIWVAIDDQPPTSKHQMTFLALDTASPYLNVFEDGTQFGKIAHYMLRWVNSRNEPGPWSETVSATIGA